MDYKTKEEALVFLTSHPGAREALVDLVYDRFQPERVPPETLEALVSARMVVWDEGKSKGFWKRSPSWMLEKNGYDVLTILRKIEDPRKWKTERS